MTPDTPPSSPVDGIVAPSDSVLDIRQEAAPAPAEPPKKAPAKGLNFAFIAAGAFAVLYVIPAFALMATFPRTDGSLQSLQQAGVAVYAVGSLVMLGLMAAGFLRISTIKDHPRMRFFALIRLFVFTVPLFFIGIGVVIVLLLPPTLRLEILSPTTPDEFVAPLSVTFGMDTALKYFTASGLMPLKYQWDYNNDGKVDQETFEPESTYLISRAAVYPIVCRVIMTNGQTKNVVYQLVIARESFAVQPSQPVIDEEATFSLENLFPKSTDSNVPKLQNAKWDFDGDGNVDLDTDKLTGTYTYHKLGPVNASVALTLINQSQQTLQRTIRVVEPMKQPFPVDLQTEPQTLLGPPPFGVVFSLTTNEPIDTVNWDFGDKKTGEGLRIAHVFQDVGNYVVIANVRSQSGSIAKFTKTVRVTNLLELPDLGFDGTPDVKNFTVEGPVPLTVDLTPTTQQPLITFSWDAQKTSEFEVNDKTFHGIYRDPGKYYIDLIGVDPDQKVLRKRITINANPPSSQVSFTMDPATPTAPSLVSFDASDTYIPPGEDITGFEWDFGDNSISNGGTKFSGARIQHQFQNPGTYIITLTIRTTAGKTYTGKQTLVVRTPLLDACFMPSRTEGKAPLGVRFDSSCSTGNFQSWTWDFGDDSQSDQPNPTHVFVNPGEYRVTLTATTKEGLTGVQSSTITVSAP